MKTYNTLTTSESIQSFLTDSGEITVCYHTLNSAADFHCCKNIVSITCNFYGVHTEMNKFYINSLFCCATPLEISVENGVICVKFDLRTKFDSLEHLSNEIKLLEELNAIVEDAQEEIKYFEMEIEICNRRRELSNFLSNKKRITDKFIDSIRNDPIILDLLYDENIHFCWCNYAESRCELKNLIEKLTMYFDGWGYDDRMDYYKSEYNKYMKYIA